MADKVDQDVREAAAEWGWLTDMGSTPEFDASHILVQAFARMKEAGRQQGLREAREAIAMIAQAEAEAGRIAVASILNHAVLDLT